MLLKLRRQSFTEISTCGELYIDEVFFCYTLEDTFRAGDIFKVKVKGETAIPNGMYELVIDDSARFKRRMPHVLNVPNFEGIRIHSGNSASDTDGCILVGMQSGIDFIGESRKAFEELFNRLEKATEKIYLTVEGHPTEPTQLQIPT